MVRVSVKLAAVMAAVAALVTGSQAARAGDKASLAGTAWVTKMKIGGERGALMMAFSAEDNEFVLVATDSEGKTVKKFEGTYTFKKGVLILFTDGKEFAREEVTALTRTELVTEDGNGKETTWQRYVPKKKGRPTDDDE
jgi:hypothetical protein